MTTKRYEFEIYDMDGPTEGVKYKLVLSERETFDDLLEAEERLLYTLEEIAEIHGVQSMGGDIITTDPDDTEGKALIETFVKESQARYAEAAKQHEADSRKNGTWRDPSDPMPF